MKSDQEIYDSESKRYLNLMSINLVQQDTATLQVSVGIIAVLATFGKDVLRSHPTLSGFAIFCLIITILLVIAGYWVSNKFFMSCLNKLGENLSNHVFPTTGLGNRYGTINSILNNVQPVIFALGIILTTILIYKYIY